MRQFQGEGIKMWNEPTNRQAQRYRSAPKPLDPCIYGGCSAGLSFVSLAVVSTLVILVLLSRSNDASMPAVVSADLNEIEDNLFRVEADKRGNEDLDDLISPETSPPFAIFYNVYIAPGETGNGLRIFKEQLTQIATSYATSTPRPVRVYYNTIGSARGLDDALVSRDCARWNMKCLHLAHYDQESEVVTLQALYDFVHRPDVMAWDQRATMDPNDMARISEQGSAPLFRVVYMHNKGSFHDNSGQNEAWRKPLTTAVTSAECLSPPDDSCNVCGLQFWYLWNIFFPGNMWVAQSQYIRRLLPPLGFDQKLEMVAREVKRRYENGQFLLTMFPTHDEDTWGLNRYASEHWVGTCRCNMREIVDMACALTYFNLACHRQPPLDRPL
jgi:hypothetical protein